MIVFSPFCLQTFLKAFLPTFDPSDSYFCFFFGLQRSGMGTFTWLDDTTLEYVLRNYNSYVKISQEKKLHVDERLCLSRFNL